MGFLIALSSSWGAVTPHPMAAVEDGQANPTTTLLDRDLQELSASLPTHTLPQTAHATSPVAQLLLPAVDPALLVPVRELFRRLSVMLDPSPSVSVLLPLPSDSTLVVSLMTPHVEPASTTLLPVLDMTPTRTTGL